MLFNTVLKTGTLFKTPSLIPPLWFPETVLFMYTATLSGRRKKYKKTGNVSPSRKRGSYAWVKYRGDKKRRKIEQKVYFSITFDRGG
jgi:hypothetical protein